MTEHTTSNDAPLNADTNADEVVVTTEDVLPMYGEGDTRAEAVADLLGSLRSLHAALHGKPDAILAPSLREQRDLLCGLSRCGPVEPIDADRLQVAMREAHGRRAFLGETYAQAIARRYNARASR